MDLNRCAYLDIETSWPSRPCVDGRWPSSQEKRVARQKKITVIGIYKPYEGIHHLIRPTIDRIALARLLDDVDVLMTYNGERFDLPVIEAEIGIDLSRLVPHRDLMHDCWRHKLKGGLKAVERALGIHRDTDGVDGVAAMNLWAAYRKGNTEALELLLRYNREDCENLKIIASKLGLDKPEPVLTVELGTDSASTSSGLASNTTSTAITPDFAAWPAPESEACL